MFPIEVALWLRAKADDDPPGVAHPEDPTSARELIFDGVSEPTLYNWLLHRLWILGERGDILALRLERAVAEMERRFRGDGNPLLAALAIGLMIRAILARVAALDPAAFAPPESAGAALLRPPGGKTDRYAPIC